jgi:hypothetical protein
LFKYHAAAVGHRIDRNALRAVSGGVCELPPWLSIGSDHSLWSNGKSINRPTPIIAKTWYQLNITINPVT